MTRADTVSNLIYLLRGILELGRIEQKPRESQWQNIGCYLESFVSPYLLPQSIYPTEMAISLYFHVYERISFRTKSLKDL